MDRVICISRGVFARLPVGVACAAFALSIAASGQASAATKEVTLASASQALAYCKSGKMPSNDVAYINGAGGLAQFGPGASCAQKAATSPAKKAVEVKGKRVLECNLSAAKAAVTFCNSGAMGEWDIAYISGKVGRTISGPGYGCGVNFSTSSIGNAICR